MADYKISPPETFWPMLTGITVTVIIASSPVTVSALVIGLEHAVPGITAAGVFPDAHQPQQRLLTLHAIPTVLSVSPDHGPAIGGTAVTVTGTYFEATADCLFDGVAATAVVVVNSTTLTCITPEHAPGLVSISVSNDGVHYSELAAAYTYPALLNATPPYEVIAASFFTLWVAPVGTTFPDIDAEPDSSDWTLVGSSGPRNYTDAGVTVEHAQSIVLKRSLVRPGPRRAVRVDESLWIRVAIADLTLEQYRLALYAATLTTTPAGPGVVGSKHIGLSRGMTAARHALLVRGPSPYRADGALQYEIPVAVQAGTPQPIFRGDQPAALALAWQALIDPDALTADEQFGRLVAQVA